MKLLNSPDMDSGAALMWTPPDPVLVGSDFQQPALLSGSEPNGGFSVSSAADADPAPGSDPPSPSEERHPKPSKRLLIVADCKWGGDSERSYVLKKLCEAMALDNLDRPFWIRKYLITPVDQTVDDSSGNRCIQYKVHISTPLVKEQAPPTGNPGSHGGEQAVRAAAEHGQEGSDGSTGSDPVWFC